MKWSSCVKAEDIGKFLSNRRGSQREGVRNPGRQESSPSCIGKIRKNW